MKNILNIVAKCQRNGLHLSVNDSGTDLKIKGNIKNLTNTEIEEIRQYKPAIIQFLRSIQQSTRPIIAVPEQPDYSLSPAQRRLWILSQAGESNAAYNMNGVYVFTGAIDIAALEQAFEKLLERHHSLRTVFRENVTGEARQVILPTGAYRFTIHQQDLSLLPDNEQYVKEQIDQDLRTPFNLSTGLLLRAALYQVANSRWIFSYTMHHIISDGWSMGILIRELTLMYNSIVKKEELPLQPLHIQYRDYAAWKQQIIADTFKKDKLYWQEQFSGDLPVLSLPSDKPRPAVKTFNGQSYKWIINAEHSQALKALCREEGATLFMGLMAMVNTLLYRYSGQQDIITGSPVAGRDHHELEDQIGFYVNTLAIRNRFNATNSFVELLASVKNTVLQAYEHQHYPFEELVEAVTTQRDGSRNPLFDVWVVLHNIHSGPGQQQISLENFEATEYTPLQGVTARYDLSFSFQEVTTGIAAELVYNTDLYTAPWIGRLAGHFDTLFGDILKNPQKKIPLLNLLPVHEQQELLAGFNPVPATAPPAKTIVDLFEEQVAKTPDDPAVVFENTVLSYAALNAKANQLAGHLRSHYHIQPNDLVAIKLERSEKMIIAILGIMKSGGAYVPIDLEYPHERVDFMIEDSACKAVVDESLLLTALQQKNNSNLPAVNQPADMAYVIYTSGSTGKPKGVMIGHAALVDYYYGLLQVTNIQECRSFGIYSTIAADLGNTVIYASLLSGGALHILPISGVPATPSKKTPVPDCIKIVPSHWKALQSQQSPCIPAKTLIFGGERLSPDVIEIIGKKYPGLVVYNHYGPTETTIGKLIDRVNIETPGSNIPLGKPFGNNRVYILNEYQQLMPKGVAGEICIGGKGLARGYLNRPELTAEKFVADPFQPGECIYRTGDTGRWTDEGKIEFLGRKDAQVKIRGYRIEPGEVETALAACSGIAQAVVMATPDEKNELQLVAWITTNAPVDPSQLRTELIRHIPAYMAPAHIIPLAQFPVTRNGKIDRAALEIPGVTRTSQQLPVATPETDIEKKLAAIWSECLEIGIEKIGRNNSFLDLGGHSLKAIKVMLKIYEQFQIKIDLAIFFNAVTIESLGQQIENRLWVQKAPAIHTKNSSIIL
jgi:amino acid adenylation domain-containing protein